MSNNTRTLTRDADAATAKVRALENRRADRQDEHAVLGAEVAELDERIVAADARGEPTATLEAERERRLQRQRDLAAVLPLLEQQLAEARAEVHVAGGQLVNATRDATREAVTRDGRALDAKTRAFLKDTTALRASVQNGLNELARLDERADYFAGRKHTRGPQSVYTVAREVPLLLNVLQVSAKWAAGQPALVEVPAAPQATSAPDPLAERLARTAGAR